MLIKRLINKFNKEIIQYCRFSKNLNIFIDLSSIFLTSLVETNIVPTNSIKFLIKTTEAYLYYLISGIKTEQYDVSMFLFIKTKRIFSETSLTTIWTLLQCINKNLPAVKNISF